MKIKLSKSQWKSIGKKTGWIKTAKIGIDDIEKIISHVNEIWKLMDNLKGVYKFAPERNSLMNFQLGMERVLPHAEASCSSVVKVADEGSSQTMPLDGVQSSPAAKVEFEESKKAKIPKIETKKQSKEEMLDVYLKFKNGGRANEKGVTEKDVDPQELAMGIEVEAEHTSDKETAKRIALDHLAETNNIKSKYYTYLKELEKRIEEEDKASE